jgi:hypothetical protein
MRLVSFRLIAPLVRIRLTAPSAVIYSTNPKKVCVPLKDTQADGTSERAIAAKHLFG